MTNIKMAQAGQAYKGARPKQRDEEGLDLQLSAANRRKKKRPSAGLKTIEVFRGRMGFGFTLSGQSPCVLSSVIQGSPAERTGLRSGDSLIAVNGRTVSALAHNEVVRLISASKSSVVVQIAENYCSDSSSGDEGERSRPKFPHRRLAKRELPSGQQHSQRELWLLNNQARGREGGERLDGSEARGREERLAGEESPRGQSPGARSAGGDRRPHSRVSASPHGRSLSADSSFLGELQPSSTPRGAPHLVREELLRNSTPRGVLEERQGRRVELGQGEELALGGEQLSSFLSQNLSELRQSMKLHQARRHNVDISSAEAKCLVGYLGTIEMPEGVGREGGLQEIRNCIRRLRVEKKVHTLVLLCIFPARVLLINHHGLKLAEFPAENIRFCGVYADDRRFFGLVTSQSREGEASTSSSCHVFMVEPVTSHHERIQRAATFQFAVTPGPGGEFLEFPNDADPILKVIYQLRGLEVASPSPSDQASIASSVTSNSDSGIGGRDTEPSLLQALPPGPRLAAPPPSQEGDDRRSSYSHEGDLRRSSYSLGDERRSSYSQARPPSPSPSPGSAKLTVRAMPDPSNQPASVETSFTSDRLGELHSAETIRQSMQKYLQDKHEHLKKTSQQLVDSREEAAASQASDLQLQLARRLQDRQQRPVSGHWGASVSEASFVRSLEDLRSQCGSEGGQGGPPSLPMHAGLPLARFLYSSDSNLSTLEAVPPLPRPLDLNNHPLNKWQQEQGSVLRPESQYPEPLVSSEVKRRPRSQLSGVSSSYRASVHVESCEYDSLGRLSHRVSQLGPGRTQSLKRGDRGSREGEARLGSQEGLASSRGSVSTLGRRRERRKSDSASIIGEPLEGAGSAGGQAGGKKDIGRVGGWAADFDKLLGDTAGLQTFAEFLKKEFSHENIYFWCAAQRYRGVESGSERLRLARDITAAYMAAGASDPVNVDSVARSSTQERLAAACNDFPPPQDLFLTAQSQIYNLMKLDSFSRFLKSDVYKDSLLADMACSPLPFDGSDLEPELQTSPLDLNQSGDSIKNKSGETRRKSILPWNIKNRSKSKDRADAPRDSAASGFIKKLTGGGSGREERARSTTNLVSGREGLTTNTNLVVAPGREEQANHTAESCDREACTLTRFILPDRATTVVSTPQGETLRSLVSRLLDKRGLKYTSFDAFLTGQDKPLDLSEDCSNLGCSEVRVEPRVLFRLELPSKKSIGVKAKQSKLVEEVLGPILSQYGWQLDTLSVRLDSSDRRTVDLRASVTTIDNQRLVVSSPDQESEDGHSVRSGDSRPGSRSSLQRPELRRLSTSSADSRKNSEEMMPPPRLIPTVAARRPPVEARRGRPPAAPPGSEGREQETSLYEGLKQMTKGRLDDQRGLEINGELPDFLKTPRSRMSEPLRAGSREGQARLSEAAQARLSFPGSLGSNMSEAAPSRLSEGSASRLSESAASRLSEGAAPGSGRLSAPGVRASSWDTDHARNYIDYIDSTFTSDGGTVPSLVDPDQLFNTCNPDESLNFSESRLSLGMARVSIGYNTSANSMEGLRLVQRPSIGSIGAGSVGHSGASIGSAGHSIGSMGQSIGPSIGEYETLTLASSVPGSRGSLGQHGLPRSGRATPTSRDYESLTRGGVEGSRRGREGAVSDYEYLSYGGRGGGGLPQPPAVAPKPRLTSVEEGDMAVAPPYKRVPPPLPPKPARVPPPLPPHAQHLHSNFGKGGGEEGELPRNTGELPRNTGELPVGVTRTKSGLYLGLPGEKGYNVSFV